MWELFLVKRMIRGTGDEMTSAYSQTLNGFNEETCLIEVFSLISTPSGPFLVSRTGDAG
jgi:hypothetical protein